MLLFNIPVLEKLNLKLEIIRSIVKYKNSLCHVLLIMSDKKKKSSKNDPLIDEMRQREEFKKDNPDAMELFDSVVDKLIGKKEDIK